MIIGIIGNTELTLKGINLLIDQGHTVDYVFGLEQEHLESKVNSVDLKSVCLKHNIKHISGGSRFSEITKRKTDLVIALGDSRLIPVRDFSCPVIGNHGAALPDVKGGASLVWARLINSGRWGVSLMDLDEKLDSGRILGVNRFDYPVSMSMHDFVSLCDDKTIELLDGYINNTLTPPEKQNEKTMITVGKHIDSQVGTTLAIYADVWNLSIYLPPRTPKDSIMKESWDSEFKQNFKLANNTPYLKHK